MGNDIESGDEGARLKGVVDNESASSSSSSHSFDGWGGWRKKKGCCFQSLKLEAPLVILFTTVLLAGWVFVHSIAGDEGLWYVPLIFDCVLPVILMPILLIFSVKWHTWPHTITVSCAMLWIPCVCIPIAVNEGRLHRADYLSDFHPPNRIEANCWKYPLPQVSPHDWAQTVNLIHWSDPDWFLNITDMKYTSVADEETANVYYTYCVAPIALNDSVVLPECSGYNAYAMCYEQRTSAGPCSQTALNACGWQFPPGISVSRVARGNSIFGAGAEPQFAEVASQLTFQFGNNYTRIGVWWLDDDTDYWAFEGDELFWWRETLWIVAGASWGGMQVLVWLVVLISHFTCCR